ncbi:MAG: hypothetical protein IKE30_05005 [Clostridia bacterium]|nr:hypothetical protein [Clostridia bacterium]
MIIPHLAIFCHYQTKFFPIPRICGAPFHRAQYIDFVTCFRAKQPSNFTDYYSILNVLLKFNILIAFLSPGAVPGMKAGVTSGSRGTRRERRTRRASAQHPDLLPPASRDADRMPAVFGSVFDGSRLPAGIEPPGFPARRPDSGSFARNVFISAL